MKRRRVRTNGYVPPGIQAAPLVPPEVEMAAYDRLPAAARQAVGAASFEMSPDAIEKGAAEHGIGDPELLARLIREQDERTQQAFRDETGWPKSGGNP